MFIKRLPEIVWFLFSKESVVLVTCSDETASVFSIQQEKTVQPIRVQLTQMNLESP